MSENFAVAAGLESDSKILDTTNSQNRMQPAEQATRKRSKKNVLAGAKKKANNASAIRQKVLKKAQNFAKNDYICLISTASPQGVINNEFILPPTVVESGPALSTADKVISYALSDLWRSLPRKQQSISDVVNVGNYNSSSSMRSEVNQNQESTDALPQRSSNIVVTSTGVPNNSITTASASSYTQHYSEHNVRTLTKQYRDRLYQLLPGRVLYFNRPSAKPSFLPSNIEWKDPSVMRKSELEAALTALDRVAQHNKM